MTQEKIRHGGFKIGSEVDVIMYEHSKDSKFFGKYSIEVERKEGKNHIVGAYFSYDVAIQTLSRVCR